MKKTCLALALVLLLSACAHTQPIPIPTEHPAQELHAFAPAGAEIAIPYYGELDYAYMPECTEPPLGGITTQQALEIAAAQVGLTRNVQGYFDATVLTGEPSEFFGQLVFKVYINLGVVGENHAVYVAADSGEVVQFGQVAQFPDHLLPQPDVPPMPPNQGPDYLPTQTFTPLEQVYKTAAFAITELRPYRVWTWHDSIVSTGNLYSFDRHGEALLVFKVYFILGAPGVDREYFAVYVQFGSETVVHISGRDDLPYYLPPTAMAFPVKQLNLPATPAISRLQAFDIASGLLERNPAGGSIRGEASLSSFEGRQAWRVQLGFDSPSIIAYIAADTGEVLDFRQVAAQLPDDAPLLPGPETPGKSPSLADTTDITAIQLERAFLAVSGRIGGYDGAGARAFTSYFGGRRVIETYARFNGRTYEIFVTPDTGEILHSARVDAWPRDVPTWTGTHLIFGENKLWTGEVLISDIPSSGVVVPPIGVTLWQAASIAHGLAGTDESSFGFELDQSVTPTQRGGREAWQVRIWPNEPWGYSSPIITAYIDAYTWQVLHYS